MEKMTERTQGHSENTAIANLALGVIPIDFPASNEHRKFEPVREGFQLQYEHPNGRLYQGNSFLAAVFLS